MDGEGYLLTPNNDKYEGRFKEGKPHGKGVLISGQTTYEGRFKKGMKDGEGRL